jgi:ligand-binding SRPBCC domain-containing protein
MTPDHMSFEVTSESTPKMYLGQIISYKIGILPGIKVKWVTEITHVSDRNHFVDEQRFGPYRMWHHEHFFEENAAGVLMTFKVSLKIPFRIIGHLAYFIFHEVVFHQRLHWFDKWRNTYIRALSRAHGMHHKHHVKENGECFGLLIFPFRFLKIEIDRTKN